MSTTEPISIADAASSLGLPKATLRHILQRPDRRARLVRAYRTTKKGLRTVEMVPPDLLAEIRETYQPGTESSIDDVISPDHVDESVENERESPESEDKTAGQDDSEEAEGIAEPASFESQEGDAAEFGSMVEAAADTQIRLGMVSQQTGDAMMIVATYERLLAEKEARLIDMRAALESERENARRLGDALARAQQSAATEKPKGGFWARMFGLPD